MMNWLGEEDDDDDDDDDEDDDGSTPMVALYSFIIL